MAKKSSGGKTWTGSEEADSAIVGLIGSGGEALVAGVTPKPLYRRGATALLALGGYWYGKKSGNRVLRVASVAVGTALLTRPLAQSAAEKLGYAALPEEGDDAASQARYQVAKDGAIGARQAVVTASGTIDRTGISYAPAYAAGYAAGAAATGTTVPNPPSGYTSLQQVGYWEGAADATMGRSNDATRYLGASPPAPAFREARPRAALGPPANCFSTLPEGQKPAAAHAGPSGVKVGATLIRMR